MGVGFFADEGVGWVGFLDGGVDELFDFVVRRGHDVDGVQLVRGFRGVFAGSALFEALKQYLARILAELDGEFVDLVELGWGDCVG